MSKLYQARISWYVLISLMVLSFTHWRTLFAADPVGDYGDAPDDNIYRFPTKYATTHSRVSLPGAHHLITGLEKLGTNVSAEAGASDPLDPDGVPNLVDNDQYDDGLLGTETIFVGSAFVKGLPIEHNAKIRITIDASAPDTTRSLNILVDKNQDNEWKLTNGNNEWPVRNLPITILPGNTEDIIVSLGKFPDKQFFAWTRITLTREKIDENLFIGKGGWDGSGVFTYGETEDYYWEYIPPTPTPPVPTETPTPTPGETPTPGPSPTSTLTPSPTPTPFSPCNCRLKLKVLNDPLVLDHCEAGVVQLQVVVSGSCAARFDGMKIDNIGPMFGLGVVNGAVPGNIGAAVPPVGSVFTPPGGTITVPITPICDPPKRIQSFGIKFIISCWCGANKVIAGSKTAGVIIHHNFMQKKGMLLLHPGMTPGNYPVPGTDCKIDAGLINNMGTIWVTQVDDFFPGSDPFEGDVIQRYWSMDSFFDIFFDVIQTEIKGLTLGYDDSRLPVGITDETKIVPAYREITTESFFDVFTELSLKKWVVHEDFIVEPMTNEVIVINPPEFSLWALGLRSAFEPVSTGITYWTMYE